MSANENQLPHNAAEWSEWKGTMIAKMETAEDRLLEIETRMVKLEEKVSDVVAKLTVPLFLAGVAGPIIGGLLVAVISRALK